MTQEKDELYFVEGFSVPETPAAGEQPQPWKTTHIVGSKRPRVDAYERVSGSAIYPSDVTLPNMIYGVVLGCPYPNAKIKSVDISQAQRAPGRICRYSGINPPCQH